ncbi:hypothetical protein GN956_G2574 [Arapaima gigas]
MMMELRNGDARRQGMRMHVSGASPCARTHSSAAGSERSSRRRRRFALGRHVGRADPHVLRRGGSCLPLLHHLHAVSAAGGSGNQCYHGTGVDRRLCGRVEDGLELQQHLQTPGAQHDGQKRQRLSSLLSSLHLSFE